MREMHTTTGSHMLHRHYDQNVEGLNCHSMEMLDPKLPLYDVTTCSVFITQRCDVCQRVMCTTEAR